MIPASTVTNRTVLIRRPRLNILQLHTSIPSLISYILAAVGRRNDFESRGLVLVLTAGQPAAAAVAAARFAVRAGARARRFIDRDVRRRRERILLRQIDHHR